MTRALIFDLDGTLVDTTPVYLSAYIKVLRRIGIEPRRRIIASQFGRKATDIMTEVLGDMGVDPGSIDIESVIASVRSDFMKNADWIRLLPGAAGILKEAHAGYKTALATSSRRYAAGMILERFSLAAYFDAVVTGDDVAHSKPHPEIFLLAARRLGVKPEDCVVFEDALHGIRAARAAGMMAVAVATGVCGREELEKGAPDLVVDNLEDFDFSILN